jgi:hypothetical protein
VGLTALLSLFPSWAAAVGLDLWTVPGAVDELGQEANRDEQLDEALQATQRRTVAKAELAQEAAAGRLTLFEAAARFRDLDAGVTEDYRCGWRHLAEGASDEERYCRQVIGYARLALRDRSDGPALLDRLRAQLDEALARGDLRLPG